MTIEIVPTAEDHRRTLRFTLRRTVRIERGAGVVFVLGALPALLSDGPGPLSGLFFLAVGLGLVVSSFLLPIQLARRVPAEAMRPRTLRIGPEGLGVRDEYTSAQVAWPAVRSVTRTPYLWVLRRDRMVAPLTLMRRYFTDEQVREFEGYLAAHGLGAGGTAAEPAGHPLRPSVPDDERG